MRCDHCGRALREGWTFQMGGEHRCPRCALGYRPMLRRSLATSAVVGTVLVLINQSTVFAQGQLPASLLWQIPLTYAVPFCVATWGALTNSRR